jgi:hypothetical protein
MSLRLIGEHKKRLVGGLTGIFHTSPKTLFSKKNERLPRLRRRPGSGSLTGIARDYYNRISIGFCRCNHGIGNKSTLRG